MTPEMLHKIYTASEAADRLRLTNRALIKIARRHGYCSRFGRDYLFSEAYLLAVWQILREPVKKRRQLAAKAAISDCQLYRSLLKLTGSSKRKRKANV